jgi:multiple sugar transport system substrate-binding protein
MTSLKGMTWSHPRGYDPLVACARLWRERTGVEIAWDARSLQDFESFPIEELARRYDLIVIDHPHAGQATREGCLLPLERAGRTAALAELARQSVGASFESYRHGGHLWAIPVDAAAQVQAWRADRLEGPARDWAAVIELARRGLVSLPLRPPHALMVFFTLAANLGHSCADGEGRRLVDPGHGREVYERLRALAAHVDAAAYAMDPIAALEMLAKAESPVACLPYSYGYVSYGVAGFRPARLAFADIPDAGALGPVGSTLGGTGLAISARSADPEAALDFALWVAGAEAQRGPYAAAGGQVGNARAWEDAAVDAAAGGFYGNTRATLEGAWVRPRHDGYIAFQDPAAQRIIDGLRAGEAADPVVADLNRMYAASFRS